MTQENKQTIIDVTRFVPLRPFPSREDGTAGRNSTLAPQTHTHTHTHTHTQMPAQVTVLIQVLEKDVTNMSIVQIHGTGPLQQTVRTTIQLRILLLLLQDTTLSFGQIHCYQQPKGELLLPFPCVRLTGPTFVGTPSKELFSYPSRQPNITCELTIQGQHDSYAQRRTSPCDLRVPLIPGFPLFPCTYLVRR